MAFSDWFMEMMDDARIEEEETNRKIRAIRDEISTVEIEKDTLRFKMINIAERGETIPSEMHAKLREYRRRINEMQEDMGELIRNLPA